MVNSIIGGLVTLLLVMFLLRRQIKNAFLHEDISARGSADEELTAIIEREKDRMRDDESRASP
ncbi:hypothetical protein [Planctopirus hydrillae]|uniref:Uncharacterized protein n=1 Tax=Planctopirus hydrillae TaxID=1841610 RepID=A0A1C3ENZ5_9PLAN|nr:hypothetical protein [Planctopirus hydrillae]ODA34960.1 hypothetical protein A6X21_04805 [Planctopirus hydrillae]